MNTPPPSQQDPLASIPALILFLRDRQVILDADLARLYGVPTKRFNEQVRRNPGRFPPDFAFTLSADEWAALRSQIATLNARGRGQHRKYPPTAFTEHGALMAANVLNSPRAVAMSLYVIRAFVQMREEKAANAALLKRLAEIDKTLLAHDVALRDIHQKLLPLLAPPPRPAQTGNRLPRQGSRRSVPHPPAAPMNPPATRQAVQAALAGFATQPLAAAATALFEALGYFLQCSNVGHRDDFPKIVLKETRELPIPAEGCSAFDRDTFERIAHLVVQICEAKQAAPDADTSAWEQEIDQHGLWPLRSDHGGNPDRGRVHRRAGRTGRH